MTQPDISEGWAAGESVTAQKLNRFTKDMFDWLLSHREPQIYTPQLLASSVDPTLGSGSTVLGRYWRDPITGRCWGQIFIKFGTSGVSAGSGSYRVTLPTAARGAISAGSTGQADIWGWFTIRDDSNVGASRLGYLTAQSANAGPGGVAVASLSILDGTQAFVFNSYPWVWANGDAIAGTFSYPELLT